MTCTNLLIVRGNTYTEILFVVYLKFTYNWASSSFSGNPIQGAYLALGSRDWGMGPDKGDLKVLCYLKGPKLKSYQGQAVSQMREAGHPGLW